VKDPAVTLCSTDLGHGRTHEVRLEYSPRGCVHDGSAPGERPARAGTLPQCSVHTAAVPSKTATCQPQRTATNVASVWQLRARERDLLVRQNADQLSHFDRGEQGEAEKGVQPRVSGAWAG